MEEQRQRQEEEARRSGAAPAADPSDAGAAPAAVSAGAPASSEDAMLERALAMSMDLPATQTAAPTSAPTAAPTPSAFPDFATMTEEEQIAYAMQMSMQEARKSDFSLYLYTCQYDPKSFLDGLHRGRR